MLWREFLNEFKKDWDKLPNIVTEIRLLFCLLPGMLLLIDSENLMIRISAMIILLIIATTDALDGYLARKLDQITELGKILDPLVDKVLAATTLIALSFISNLAFALLIFSVVRAVSLGIRLAAIKRAGGTFAVVYSGKVNTVLLTITMALLFLPQAEIIQTLSIVALTATVLTSLMSWIEYLTKYPRP